MRGSAVANTPTLPPATDGFIKDGHYSYSGASPVYAERQLRGTVRSVGTVGQFRRIGPGFGQTGLSMAVVTNDQKDTNIVSFWVSRSGWNVKIGRADDALTPVVHGDFSPMLKLDQDYQFDIEITDDTVTVNVPGAEKTTNVSTVGLLGDRAFWQEYPLRMPADQVFDFDQVWAVEDGQPLVPVPAAG